MSTDLPTQLRTDRSGIPVDNDADNRHILGRVSVFRVASLAAILVLTGTYVSVLWNVARVVNTSGFILPTVAAMIAAATLLARSISTRTAGVVAIVLAGVGYTYYLFVTPVGLGFLFAQGGALIADVFALLTGLPIIRMIRADIWALAFVPGPAFFSWYLAMRRRYTASVVVGGSALSFLVLSSDAGTGVTLAGSLAGIAAVGFGELDRRDGTLLQADVLVILVALILVSSVVAATVPGSDATLITSSTDSISGASSTVEGTLVGASNRAPIVGSISLSPAVRFSVKADEPRYWRTGIYDRYTGQGWVRTGDARPYEGPLDDPKGPRRTVVQTYTVESSVATMPAAAEPVRVVGDATSNTQVTRQRNLQPRSSFNEGDQYRVYSQVPVASPEQLRSAGTDYPAEIEEQYTTLPEDTPARIGNLTSQITASADNPYDTTVQIEQYLEENKEYSLEIDRPSGQIADSFLFEMDAGYCTYFATTMIVMLRSQGIPARMAVGYTSGQQVGEDKWVVRGLNSHAWVEVFFPEQGWVTFDPTPSDPRQSAEQQAVEDARDTGGAEAVDTDASEDSPITPSTTTTTETRKTSTLTNDTVAAVNRSPTPPRFAQETEVNSTGNLTAGSGPASNPNPFPPLPSWEHTILGVVFLLGAVAGAHRFGVTGHVYETARLYWHGGRRTPEADAKLAFERLEIYLTRRYRPRKPGETPRQYVDSLAIANAEDRFHHVIAAYERARYGGNLDREAADEAVALVNAMVRESTPLLSRFVT